MRVSANLGFAVVARKLRFFIVPVRDFAPCYIRKSVLCPRLQAARSDFGASNGKIANGAFVEYYTIIICLPLDTIIL